MRHCNDCNCKTRRSKSWQICTMARRPSLALTIAMCRVDTRSPPAYKPEWHMQNCVYITLSTCITNCKALSHQIHKDLDLDLGLAELQLRVTLRTGL